VNDKQEEATDQFFTLLEALYFQEIRDMKNKMLERKKTATATEEEAAK
jgi:hypothetical protein